MTLRRACPATRRTNRLSVKLYNYFICVLSSVRSNVEAVLRNVHVSLFLGKHVVQLKIPNIQVCSTRSGLPTAFRIVISIIIITTLHKRYILVKSNYCSKKCKRKTCITSVLDKLTLLSK